MTTGKTFAAMNIHNGVCLKATLSNSYAISARIANALGLDFTTFVIVEV